MLFQTFKWWSLAQGMFRLNIQQRKELLGLDYLLCILKFFSL